jgi:hypothetical protein
VTTRAMSTSEVGDEDIERYLLGGKGEGFYRWVACREAGAYSTPQ